MKFVDQTRGLMDPSRNRVGQAICHYQGMLLALSKAIVGWATSLLPISGGNPIETDKNQR